MAIRERVDLTALRYFRAIAREASITGAARVLGVSQPTLSVAVRNLEEELATRLLLRTHEGVQLTATGVALAARAEAILASVEEAVQHVRDLQEDEIGAFVLGCNPSLGAYTLAGFLDRFLDRYPAIRMDVWNGASAEVRAAVLERTVHFGLVVDCPPHDDLVITPLFRDTVELFGSHHATPDATSARTTGLDGARRSLAGATLYWCDRPVFRALLAELRTVGTPARTVSCGDLELVKALTLDGRGLGLLPRRVARHGHIGRLRAVSPLLPRHEDTIHLIYRGDLPRTRAARRVREALLERGRELDGDPGMDVP